VSANRVRHVLSASTLLIGIASVARGQDCASAPLLGKRIAAGAEYWHSTLGETSVGASLVGRVVGRVRLSGAYEATRLDNVARLENEGRVVVSAPVSFSGFDVCPAAGASYAHLTTDKSGTAGSVVTHETQFGTSVGRSFPLSRNSRVTPFVEPVLVRRNVSWESVDAAWRVSGDDDASETQVWFGASFATSQSAVVVRFRPSRGSEPREFGVGFHRAFGRR